MTQTSIKAVPRIWFCSKYPRTNAHRLLETKLTLIFRRVRKNVYQQHIGLLSSNYSNLDKYYRKEKRVLILTHTKVVRSQSWYTPLIPALERGRGRKISVSLKQPGLHIEPQDNHRDIETPCLNKEENRYNMWTYRDWEVSEIYLNVHSGYLWCWL